MRALRIVAAFAVFARPFSLGAQVPVRPTPVPRVDSTRADTLHPPASDTARRVEMPKPAAADTARKPTLFGPNSDLHLDVRSRIEARGDKRSDERCDNGQLLTAGQTCSGVFTPTFNPQFMLRSTGSIGGRVHVNVDYDESREFDASNAFNIYYEGKTAADRLQRLEIGNVAFTLPSTRFLSSGVPSGNYGLQATGHVGPFRLNAIAAQQKGNIAQERTYFIGDRVLQSGEHEILDNQVEPRRFFFTVDPALFRGAYPNIDLLNRAQLASLAASLPDTLRPRRVVLY